MHKPMGLTFHVDIGRGIVPSGHELSNDYVQVQHGNSRRLIQDSEYSTKYPE